MGKKEENAMTQVKLGLDGGRKEALERALWRSVRTLDPYMGRIYLTMLDEIKGSSDKILLGVAEQNCARCALKAIIREEGPSPEAKDLLARLTMTRKQYAAWRQGKEETT